MNNLEAKLAEWRTAELLDEATVAKIRAFEANGTRPTGVRWQAILALTFGAILLGAGAVLFVAAHWDNLSPLSRFLLVMSTVALFHLAAAWFKPHFESMATALNAVGTIASFAAVALVGQIFNIQEHWPGGVMLCALCALAGWWLLKDQMQQTLFLLALPAWLISEWADRASHYQGQEVYLCRMIAVLAAVYLVTLAHSRRRVASGILFTAGAIALPITGAILSEGWTWVGWRHHSEFLPLHLQLTAWTWMIALLILVAVRFRHAILPVVTIFLVSIIMPYAHHIQIIHERYGQWVETKANIFAYLLGAAIAICIAWWGTKHASKRSINYGIVLFALVVGWFFFSDLMDKLDRSFSLMLMGIVFLTGGWFLEKLRRKLVRNITSQEVAA
ncbi:MAG: DUF2157 domain-containing protein [Acidobacteriaceae bacterium]|nr:DUF2157 domain-containing protein [Acidobacteriaceae bacterium]